MQSRVLQRSSLVSNVVERFNMLAEQNTRSARRSRRRILSEIALDFSFRQIRELPLVFPLLPNSTAPRKLCKRLYHEARSHARAFVPGGAGFEIPHVQKTTLTVDMITELLSYVTDDVHVQQLACGSKTVVLSNGQTLDVPSVARKMLRAHMWSEYVQQHTVDGKYIGQFKKDKFMEVNVHSHNHPTPSLPTHSITRFYSLTQSPNPFLTHSFNHPPTRL